MRIGLNLLFLLPEIVGGTETYAAGLLNGLAEVGAANEYVVFVNEESREWPIPRRNNFYRVVCPVAASSRARRYLFEQVRLPRLLKKHGIEVVHSLGYVGPLRSPCPAVVTIPDLNYLAIGHTMPIFKRSILKYFSTRAAKRAEAVITISNFSKCEISRSGQVPANKIFVTLLGPRMEGRDQPGTADADIRGRYGIAGPYIAAFGGIALHKNIPRLLQAFARLKTQFPHKLLLLGQVPANVDAADLSEDVIMTGYVPAGHVLPLLRGGAAFVLPSLYEGFGLPVLEAQQAGIPVACSSAGSLPEVAGKGALFFDPYSAEEMAEKIAMILADPKLQDNLRCEGLANIQRFSWEKTACATLGVYATLCKQGHVQAWVKTAGNK